jgi:hypothetical protein
MTSVSIPENAANEDIAKIYALLGDPPVLSTEDRNAYDGVLRGLVASLRPADFFETLLIKHIADDVWEARRNNRQKTLAVERRFRKHVEAMVCRANLDAQRRRLAASDKEQEAASPSTKVMRMYELETFSLDSAAVEEIFKRIPEELDHAKAMEASIDYYLKLDSMATKALGRQIASFSQLERYRDLIQRTTINDPDEIVVSLPSETIEAPTIVPSNQADEVGS